MKSSNKCNIKFSLQDGWQNSIVEFIAKTTFPTNNGVVYFTIESEKIIKKSVKLVVKQSQSIRLLFHDGNQFIIPDNEGVKITETEDNYYTVDMA